MRYRKKPVVIEAIQFQDDSATLVAINETLGLDPVRVSYDQGWPQIVIGTLEGEMRAEVGDYIIKGVKGEFYPCKPDIFAATYERASE